MLSKLSLGIMLLKKLKEKIYNKYYREDKVDRVREISLGNDKIVSDEKTFFKNVQNYFTSPTLIFEGDFQIWIGSSYNACNYSFMNDKHIEIVLNCSEEVPNFFKDVKHIEYYQYKIQDKNDQDVDINKINSFCKKILLNKKNIFVHCFQGASRSVLVSIILLNILTDQSYSTIYFNLMKKRPHIHINQTFFDALMKNQKKQT